MLTSPLSARRGPLPGLKKTVDISNVILSNNTEESQGKRNADRKLENNKSSENTIPQINSYAVLRTKYKAKKKMAHESLAMNSIIEDSALLQATINAQRKNSISFSSNARNKLNQKTNTETDNNIHPVFIQSESKEEEKEAQRRNAESIETAEAGSQERSMLLRYTFAWSDLATAYQQEGYFSESLDCIESAALIYERLLMYPHMSLSLGQFILARVMD